MPSGSNLHCHLSSTISDIIIQIVQGHIIQLRDVCEKTTEMNVAVRFQSMESLRAIFNYSKSETHPTLDDNSVMDSGLAARVLNRFVLPEILSKPKSLQAFWLISSLAADHLCKDKAINTHKKGSCLSHALKGNGMFRWGIRRQVEYLGRHKDSDGSDVNAHNSSSSFANGDEESHMEIDITCDEKECIEEEKNEDAEDGEFDDVSGNAEERDEDSEEKDDGAQEERNSDDRGRDEDSAEKDDGGEKEEGNDDREKEEGNDDREKEEGNDDGKKNEEEEEKIKESCCLRFFCFLISSFAFFDFLTPLFLKESLVPRDPKHHWPARSEVLALSRTRPGG